MRHHVRALSEQEAWLVRSDAKLWGVFSVKTYLAAESPRVWTRKRTSAVTFTDVNRANRHAKELGASLERL